MICRFVMTLTVVAIFGSLATAVAQPDALFPHTKQWRPATVEYSHEGLKVVVNYNYSQTNHDTPWLIIDLAASSRRRFALRPEHVTLVTPDGGIVALAKRGIVIGDFMNTRSHLAVAVRDELRGYFTVLNASGSVGNFVLSRLMMYLKSASVAPVGKSRTSIVTWQVPTASLPQVAGAARGTSAGAAIAGAALN